MSFNITPVASGYQEIHPYSAINIDSVEINTSLLMMKECHICMTSCTLKNTVCTIWQIQYTSTATKWHLTTGAFWRRLEFRKSLSLAAPLTQPLQCTCPTKPNAVMQAYKCNWDASDNQKYHLVHMLNCKINGTVHIFFLKKSYLSPRCPKLSHFFS